MLATRQAVAEFRENADPFPCICKIYPPTLKFVYWEDSESGNRIAGKVFEFIIRLCGLLGKVHDVYHQRGSVKADPLKPGAQPVSSVVCREGALWENCDFIHQSISVLRYFFQRAHPSNLEFRGASRVEADVRSPLYGKFSATCSGLPGTCSLVYLRAVDRYGRSKFLVLDYVLDATEHSGDSCASARLGNGTNRCVPLIGGSKLSVDAGLYIRNVPASRTAGSRSRLEEKMLRATSMAVVVYACSGAYDPVMSFRQSECEFFSVATEYIELATKCDLSPSERAIIEGAVKARTNFKEFDLSAHITRILGADFPRPAASLFIPIPSHPMEQELAELLLLESIVAEAESGSVEAQLLIAHVESESHLSIAEVASRQKSRLEQMLEDQQAQLTLHREAVERHNQRAKLKLTASESKADQSTPAASAQSSAAAPSESKEERQQSAPSASASTSASGKSLTLSTLAAVGLSKAKAAAAASSLAVASSSSSSADSQLSAAFSSSSSVPEWMARLGVEALLSAGRMKYRHVLKLVMAVMTHAGGSALQLQSTVNRSGSHVVIHRGPGQSPFTLVEHHGSSDSTVTRQVRTRIFQQLIGIGLSCTPSRKSSKQKNESKQTEAQPQRNSSSLNIVRFRPNSARALIRSRAT